MFFAKFPPTDKLAESQTKCERAYVPGVHPFISLVAATSLSLLEANLCDVLKG